MAPHEQADELRACSSLSGGLKIRSYTADDHATVRELFIDGMVGTYCPGDTNQGLRNYVTRSLSGDMADIQGTYFGSVGHFWVATLPDASGIEQIIGSIAIEGKAHKRGELRRLSVCKDVRRRGIGQVLIAHLETWAVTHGFDMVFLETGSEMIPAIQLYTDLGYVRFQEIPAPKNPSKILISFEKNVADISIHT